MSFLKRQDLWRDAVHVLKCIDFWRNRLKCIQRSCTHAAQLQDMQNVIGQVGLTRRIGDETSF